MALCCAMLVLPNTVTYWPRSHLKNAILITYGIALHSRPNSMHTGKENTLKSTCENVLRNRILKEMFKSKYI